MKAAPIQGTGRDLSVGRSFEIGPDEFHPPFPKVVDEYLGAGQYAGKGNREAFLIALENAVDPATHSVLTGKAPAGSTLRLRKTFATPTWDGSIQDSLDTTMTVGPDGRYTWHVNPSTRPVVMDRQIETISGDPVAEQSWTGTTAPLQSTDQEFAVDQDVDLLEINLDWPTPDDWTSRFTGRTPTARSPRWAARATPSTRRSGCCCRTRRRAPTSCGSSTSPR